MIRGLLCLALWVLVPSEAWTQSDTGEFSKANLQKTLVSITKRAKQAEEAAAAAEQSAQFAETARKLAVAQLEDVVKANTALESELLTVKAQADAVADERDAERRRADQLSRDLADQKLATETQRARAWKWTLIAGGLGAVILGWVAVKLVRLYLRLKSPILV